MRSEEFALISSLQEDTLDSRSKWLTACDRGRSLSSCLHFLGIPRGSWVKDHGWERMVGRCSIVGDVLVTFLIVPTKKYLIKVVLKKKTLGLNVWTAHHSGMADMMAGLQGRENPVLQLNSLSGNPQQ